MHPLRPAIALAVVAVGALAPAARAAPAPAGPSATLEPRPADPSLCVHGTGAPAFTLCRVWSGNGLPLALLAVDADGTPVVDGTAQLFARERRADAWQEVAPTLPLVDGAVAPRVAPARSTWYAAEVQLPPAVDGDPLPPALVATGLVRAIVAARLTPTGAGRPQHGSRYLLRGAVRYAGSALAGTVTAARCLRPAASRCRRERDFGRPLARRPLRRAGPFALPVRLPRVGTWVFRVRYRPYDHGFGATDQLYSVTYAAPARGRGGLPLAVARSVRLVPVSLPA